MPESCPLCGAASRPFLDDGRRRYLRCLDCSLSFLSAHAHPAPDAARARYLLHRNDPADAGYRAWLERLLTPLSERLRPGAAGLDFGCGPGPAASSLMRARGFAVRDYDPLFEPDAAALDARYDFIVCTEVLEHLARPDEVLRRLDSLLAPGGVLGATTGILEDDSAFRSWWYRQDPTHVAFYRPETVAWIARRFGWGLDSPGPGIFLFSKPPAP